MILKNINHDYGYHTQKIATMFFALEKIDCDGDDDIVVETIKNGDEITVNARVYSKYISKSSNIGDDDGAHALSLLLYDTLCEVTCFNVPWGILYGVRPARLMHATAEKIGDSAAYQKFISDRVEPSKAQLALDVMHSENKIIALFFALCFNSVLPDKVLVLLVCFAQHSKCGGPYFALCRLALSRDCGKRQNRR